MRDTYAQWDAAYVLGALTAAERAEFEEHVSTCPACQSAVAELAGMPGLLAQVLSGEVLAMDVPDHGPAVPPPGSLMPVLPRRRRWLGPVAAAAAALVIGGVGGYAASGSSRTPPPSASTVTVTAPAGVVKLPARLAFSAVGPSSMTAVVDILASGSGTELKVECQYAAASSGPGSNEGGYALVDYALIVVDRAGTATELMDWTARPGRVMHPSGVSPLPVAQISAVEIRRVDSGATVMRANLA